MQLNFICGRVVEYTKTYRKMHEIEGIEVNNLDLINHKLSISGVNMDNYSMVCQQLNELGWTISL